MTTIGVETISLPALPSDWAAEGSFRVLGKLSPATQRNIEPVGAHFLAEARRVCVPFPQLTAPVTNVSTRTC